MKIISAEYVLSAPDVSALTPPMYPEFTIAGRSNVGKSSLINTLLARKGLARTSSTPGATRGINIFRACVRPAAAEGTAQDAYFDFADLPGFGYAKRSKAERKAWKTLIESYLETRVGLKGIILIVDIRRGVEEDDAQLIEYAKSLERRIWLVATKTDKLPKHQASLAIKQFKNAHKVRAFGFSAVTGQGRDELWQAIWKTGTALQDPA